MSLRIDSNRPQPKVESSHPSSSTVAESSKTQGSKDGGILGEVAQAVGKVVGGVLDALTSFAGDAKQSSPAGASSKPKTGLASKDKFFGQKSSAKSSSSDSNKSSAASAAKTHKLASGETLSKVAKQHGVSLDALRKANPQLKGMDDKKLPVGFQLNIPPGAKPTGSSPSNNGAKSNGAGTTPSAGTAAGASSGAPPTPAPVPKPKGPASDAGSAGVGKPPGTAAPKPENAGSKPSATSGHEIGSLSAKYESGGAGDPGSVSPGDKNGGVSYGSHQLSSKQGTAQEFVDSLKDTHPQFHAALSGKTPGTDEFSKAWKQVAAQDPAGFGKAQKDFIDRTLYDKQAGRLDKALPELGLDQRSNALKEVVYSTAVQHGRHTLGVFQEALKGKDVSKMSDADIISAVYAERGRKRADGTLARFKRDEDPRVLAGISRRFVNEQADALKMLEKEQRPAAS